MSPEGDYEYFGDGMAEGLINSLGKVEGLRVTARTRAFAFKGAGADVLTIGEQLGVNAILEGSVQRSGSRVRVSARLGDASDGLSLWSETYDREWTDLFELQDELVHAIVSALRVELVGDADARLVQQPTEDVEAYNSYLLGRFQWNRRNSSDFEIAATHFRDAIARDSNFALAYAGLAGVHVLPESPIPFPESYSIAKGLAERALDLDSTLAEAHTVLAWIAFQNEWDWDGAERGFQRAIALDPEYSTARSFYSELLAMTARLDGAITEAERAHLLEPVSPIVTWALGRLLVMAGRDNEAEAEFLKVIAMFPAFARSYHSLATSYFLQGREEQAFEMFRQEQALRGAPPDSLAAIELAYADSGMGGVYRRRLNDPAVLFFQRLWFHAVLGETGAVLDLLQTRLESGPGLPFERLGAAVLWAPEFALVRRDPRFRVILEEMGLAEIWRDRLGAGF